MAISQLHRRPSISSSAFGHHPHIMKPPQALRNGVMTLIESLQNPALYPHPVTGIRVVETHISWLILTGPHAYKLKKPVDFGFLDFTTLSRRQHFCEEELRLNRRLAPDLYQQVVAITGSAEQPEINGAGEVIEYAVQMAQFDDSLRLDRLLAQQRFDPQWIDHLAIQIAEFHSRIPIVSSDSPWGEPDTIWEVVSDNFLHIGNVLENADDWQQLQLLSNQIAQQFRSLSDYLNTRKANGHVRECHGDLHLANITLHHNELRLFDCIEFNLQFRWIDTFCDLAFLLMDLEANGQFRWAARCLNQYLELCGDYDGVRLLSFYKAYRAMVRAKVATLGPTIDLDSFRHYSNLAQQYAERRTPTLFLMHGVSGSGKSWLSEQLCERLGLIRVRADVERKRLHRELSQGQALELYGHEMNTHTYNQLLHHSRSLLQAGYSVVVDATFIRRRARQGYLTLAQQLRVPIRILSCGCEPDELERRLEIRHASQLDASDATVEVMHDQLANMELLAEDELGWSLAVDTQQADALDQLVSTLLTQELVDELTDAVQA